VVFDLPSSVECRDVTTAEFAQTHPTLKVIEARFRISARLKDGTPSDIVEFFYTLKTDQAMRITDYSPNTTLESTVDADHIEITDATENAKTLGADAHVALKPFVLGGSHNQTQKKSESSHYKQIAARDVVLSSGTTDREHGVFYRLRPSRTDSLEGGKEFKLTATVPRAWRGALCTIACAAKGTRHSVFSTSQVEAGGDRVQVGMYLAGNLEAARLAEGLRIAQERYDALLARQQSKGHVFQVISTSTVGLITGSAAQERQSVQEAEKTVAETQQQIQRLAN
jgi:hypothetical protein